MQKYGKDSYSKFMIPSLHSFLLLMFNNINNNNNKEKEKEKSETYASWDTFQNSHIFNTCCPSLFYYAHPKL